MSDAMIKVPGVGPVKKPVALAAGGVVVGVLVYAYWKRSKANAAAAAASTTDTAATATTDPSQAIDPSTGLTYAEEAAGAGGAGYGYPSYGGYSGGGQYSQNGYDVYGNPLPAPTGLGGGAITTNNDWATEAETNLQNAGVTLAVATAAITRVLGGLTVTSTQRDYFLQSVGVLGQPPQGYPQPIKVTDNGDGPPPPTSLAAPATVHVTTVGKTTATVAWSAVPGAQGYLVTGAGHSYDVDGTSYVLHGLHPNTNYSATVQALAGGRAGPRGHTVSFKTDR